MPVSHRRRLTSLLVLTAGSLLALAPRSAAQGWQTLAPATSPQGRAGAALGYDDVRRVAVLFSGAQFQSAPPAIVFRDTWEWNGTTWSQMAPPQSPSARLDAAMAFDPNRRRLVLFGGIDLTTGQLLNDTWEYNGITWTPRPTPNAPTPRRTTIAWDPVRQRTMLFGGDEGLSGMSFNDTWEYDGSTWTQSISALAPPPAGRAAVCYDTARSVMVALAINASGQAETWERTGTGWMRRTTARTPLIGRGTMAYDPVRQVCVYFDSHTVYNPVVALRTAKTWEYDGVNWFDTTTSQRPRRLGSAATALVYDLNLATCLSFGGNPNSFPGGSTNETRSYVAPMSYGAADPYGSGCPLRLGAPPSFVMTTIPSVGHDWEGRVTNLTSTTARATVTFGLSDTTWAGFSLPYDLGTVGLPGCLLLTSVEVGVPMTPLFGQLPISISVPNSPAFAGLAFYNQLVVIDPSSPNGIGAVTSAIAAVVGS